MKAIILAAGQGKRLLPLTQNIPKCLVSLAGKTILDHAFSSLNIAGVTDITVVTGYRADKISEKGIVTRHNPAFESTNMVYSLFCAEDLMSSDDVLIVYGDIIFAPSAVSALMSDPAPFSVGVNTKWRELWNIRMEDPLTDAESLKIDPRGNIVEIGNPASSYKDIDGQYMGLLLIRKRVLPAIRTFYHSKNHQSGHRSKDFPTMYMTDFVQAVIDELMPVKSVLIDGGWVEIDTKTDIEAYQKYPQVLSFLEMPKKRYLN